MQGVIYGILTLSIGGTVAGVMRVLQVLQEILCLGLRAVRTNPRPRFRRLLKRERDAVSVMVVLRIIRLLLYALSNVMMNPNKRGLQ